MRVTLKTSPVEPSWGQQNNSSCTQEALVKMWNKYTEFNKLPVDQLSNIC